MVFLCAIAAGMLAPLGWPVGAINAGLIMLLAYVYIHKIARLRQWSPHLLVVTLALTIAVATLTAAIGVFRYEQ